MSTAVSSDVLVPVNMALYVNSDLEPQMVQERTQNSGILYLDSQDSLLELDKTNMLLSSVKMAGEKANTLARSIRRLRVLATSFHLVTPNVNPINQTIQFISSNTGATVYSVVVPTGFYTTPALLIAAIVTALNTVLGASGLTFSDAIVTGYTDKYTLTAAGGNFQILPTSNAVVFGTELWALPIMTALGNNVLVGSMGLYYTRYIDICSRRINQYVKIPSIGNGYNSNIVYRFFIGDPTTAHFERFTPSSDLNGINFQQSDSLSTIDFQIKDQFGNFLYIPPGGGPGNQSGFQWSIQFLAEF
jgi:hypothetical protein